VTPRPAPPLNAPQRPAPQRGSAALTSWVTSWVARPPSGRVASRQDATPSALNPGKSPQTHTVCHCWLVQQCEPAPARNIPAPRGMQSPAHPWVAQPPRGRVASRQDAAPSAINHQTTRQAPATVLHNANTLTP
jgi:hypothetical protein